MNHDEIKILDDRQKSRDKIAIFYGSKDNYYHGLKEVIANSTDEIISNFDFGEVEVILHDDLKTITVTDSGRGIPVDGEVDGIPKYELLFRTLFAGTKYDISENTTTGTNGVGNTVLCYTTSLFEVKSFYGKKEHYLKFINGGELVEPLKITKINKDIHGTSITFRLDPEVYPKTEYRVDEVRDIVRRFSIGSNKVKLTFKHKDESSEFFYENPLSYFEEILENQSTSSIVNSVPTLYEDDGERTEIDLSFTTSPEPIHESYLNLTYLSEGGALHDGIIAGIRNYASKYCRDNKLFPKNIKSFLVDDIESSISYVCVTLSNTPEFKNQTKLSTDKKLYRDIARKHTSHLLEIFEIEDKKNFDKFIKHLLTVQKYNSQSQRAKQKLKKTLNEKVDGIGNKVEKLVDCKKHGKDSELFIAEGNSALGSIVLARDAIWQAAYPLKGKILNCLKADYDTIFKNQVIIDLIKVLGCGISADKKNKDLESFDIKKLRFGKIIIATDADSDGSQIACLIITMFYRLMPELIKKGYIHIAQTPLYEVKLKNDEMVYFYTEDEKNKKFPTLKNVKTIARVKGLGELSSEVMYETALNPETRNLVQVTVEDVEKMTESLETWMGIDHSNRREYIAENLHKYVELVD